MRPSSWLTVLLLPTPERMIFHCGDLRCLSFFDVVYIDNIHKYCEAQGLVGTNKHMQTPTQLWVHT